MCVRRPRRGFPPCVCVEGHSLTARSLFFDDVKYDLNDTCSAFQGWHVRWAAARKTVAAGTCNAQCERAVVLSPFQASPSPLLMTLRGGHSSYPGSTGEETGAQRGEETCLRCCRARAQMWEWQWPPGTAPSHAVQPLWTWARKNSRSSCCPRTQGHRRAWPVSWAGQARALASALCRLGTGCGPNSAPHHCFSAL